MIKTLIVDDESLVRKGLLVALPWTAFGFDIVGEAQNAEKALQFLSENAVDILFTDITMPGKSGLELMQEVREAYPHLSVVVLTCHQDFDYIQEALRLGAIDYIVKTQLESHDVNELLARIATRIRSENSVTTGQGKVEASGAPSVERRMEEIEQSWSSLIWMLQPEPAKQLCKQIQEVNDSFHKQRELVKGLCAQWQARLPWLEGMEEVSLIAQAEHTNSLLMRMTQLQQSVIVRLRSSLYSEEVLQSIIKAIDYIHDHIGDKLQQADLSRTFNMSRSYFSRCFKEIVGIPFVNYVQELSIRQAEHLLTTTNHPIYWIAEKCGFSDEKYFSRMFREKRGMLPTEYRILLRPDP
ncbi:hypothetical protein B1748_04865 [Paenibacillus sp. MY03]|uniref:response regulator n=1 Tax=Paenibacillus sp. MY03 TaxID=302980 RepID=UPI000B3C460A|nr:response regulator [Paenibacillus sp. MY03]OUS78099.1 hypothetical protein B1748_04865 [Paenibacillus sp. MY03]